MMQKRKNIFLMGIILVMICMNPIIGHATSSSAAQNVNVEIDGNGGTFHTSTGYDFFDSEAPIAVGSCVSSSLYSIDYVSCVDKEFLGWYVYDAQTNTQIPGTGLMTTAELLSYTIPNHNIKFVAQWSQRSGAPVTAITYATFYNSDSTAEPDYNVTISMIVNDVCYSGQGFITIPQSIYSTWSGDIEIILECPGEFTRANNKWIPDEFSFTCPVRTFKKEGSAYWPISTTGKGKDLVCPRNEVNDFFYSVRDVMPNISSASSGSTGISISSPADAPVSYSIDSRLYEAGNFYDKAVCTALDIYGTDHVLVYDIDVKDENGQMIHQLDNTIDVRIDIPADYLIQSGYTAIVYYLADDGSAEECETVYDDSDPDNRYVIFKTNHFSIYIVTEVEATKQNPTVPEDEVKTETKTEADTEPVTENKVTHETEQSTETVSTIDSENNTYVETESDKPIEGKTEINYPVYIIIVVCIIAILTVCFIWKRRIHYKK